MLTTLTEIQEYLDEHRETDSQWHIQGGSLKRSTRDYPYGDTVYTLPALPVNVSEYVLVCLRELLSEAVNGLDDLPEETPKRHSINLLTTTIEAIHQAQTDHPNSPAAWNHTARKKLKSLVKSGKKQQQDKTIFKNFRKLTKDTFSQWKLHEAGKSWPTVDRKHSLRLLNNRLKGLEEETAQKKHRFDELKASLDQLSSTRTALVTEPTPEKLMARKEAIETFLKVQDHVLSSEISFPREHFAEAVEEYQNELEILNVLCRPVIQALEKLLAQAPALQKNTLVAIYKLQTKINAVENSELPDLSSLYPHLEQLGLNNITQIDFSGKHVREIRDRVLAAKLTFDEVIPICQNLRIRVGNGNDAQYVGLVQAHGQGLATLMNKVIESLDSYIKACKKYFNALEKMQKKVNKKNRKGRNLAGYLKSLDPSTAKDIVAIENFTAFYTDNHFASTDLGEINPEIAFLREQQADVNAFETVLPNKSAATLAQTSTAPNVPFALEQTDDTRLADDDNLLYDFDDDFSDDDEGIQMEAMEGLDVPAFIPTTTRPLTTTTTTTAVLARMQATPSTDDGASAHPTKSGGKSGGFKSWFRQSGGNHTAVSNAYNPLAANRNMGRGRNEKETARPGVDAAIDAHDMQL